MRRMFTMFLVIGSGYVAVVGLAYAFQDQLLYFPSSALVATPDQYGLAYESVQIDTDDGEQLHGWWIPADSARGTLLFFHGNAGNISGRLENVQQFHQLGLNVLIFDYRGYGKSTGAPSEEGLYRDAEAAWQHLVTERRIDPSEIVIFGRSLGGGPATWLATRHEAGALMLESAFTSVPDMAAEHYPWLPARQLTVTQFNNRDQIDQIDAPLLVIHSRGDEVVPFDHGRQLFEAAREPKQFLEISGNHNDGFLVSADRYLRAIDAFLGDVLSSTEGDAS